MNNKFIIYIVGINFLSFLLIGIDKLKAIKKDWRIKENTLLITSFLGGSIGTLIGMIIFHHKTHKKKFQILVPLSILFQSIILKKVLTLPLTVVLFYK